MRKQDLALGVDIGGTKIAVGIVDHDGNVLFKARVPMNSAGSDQEALDGVHNAIRTALDTEFASRITAIGVASPGPLELPSGRIINAPNLPCWRNFPLGDRIREAYSFSTFVENDANAAGLAEAMWGAGRNFDNLFYVTIGTGIGTAIVVDRELQYTRTRIAPEGGHMTIDYRGER